MQTEEIVTLFIVINTLAFQFCKIYKFRIFCEIQI